MSRGAKHYLERRAVRIAISILGAGALAFSANAQELVYEPVNPSFGGNPFNSAHLLALANAQNDYERPAEEESASSDLDRFVRSLQSRLLSALSTQVANAIFGEDAQDEGTIVFGDQTISFVRTLDGIQLTITEADGSQTVITIPTLTTTEGSDSDSDANAQADFKLTAPSILTAPGSLESALGQYELTPLSTRPIEQPIQ